MDDPINALKNENQVSRPVNDSPVLRLKSRLLSLSKNGGFFAKALKRLIIVYRNLRRYGSVSRELYCKRQKNKPLQNNKIVFISHKGLQYSCNPMYLCEYLLQNYPGKFEIVWAFKEPEKFDYLHEKGIRTVKRESKEHLNDLMTAKVIVTNVDFYLYLPDRPGRIALDTWHGGGSYKTCGFANIQNLHSRGQKNHYKKLYGKVNLYCSSSAAFTQETIRESRLFQGEVMEVGMPRNDILVNHDRPDIEKKVRRYYNIGDDTKIVLYAPTYRSAEEMLSIPQIDTSRLIRALHERFGGEWICLFRHHHLGNWENEGAISATDYPDMQELLYSADVLVSDYSSCIWDFSLMFKPVFLYCPDLSKYESSRNFYMPIEQWPYILCDSQQALENSIIGFDESAYRSAIAEHHRILGNCETGHATETICRRIAEECLSAEA